MSNSFTGLQLRSLVKSSGELEISLTSVETPAPQDDEVIVRVQAHSTPPTLVSYLARLMSAPPNLKALERTEW